MGINKKPKDSFNPFLTAFSCKCSLPNKIRSYKFVVVLIKTWTGGVWQNETGSALV